MLKWKPQTLHQTLSVSRIALLQSAQAATQNSCFLIVGECCHYSHFTDEGSRGRQRFRLALVSVSTNRRRWDLNPGSPAPASGLWTSGACGLLRETAFFCLSWSCPLPLHCSGLWWSVCTSVVSNWVARGSSCLSSPPPRFGMHPFLSWIWFSDLAEGKHQLTCLDVNEGLSSLHVLFRTMPSFWRGVLSNQRSEAGIVVCIWFGWFPTKYI